MQNCEAKDKDFMDENVKIWLSGRGNGKIYPDGTLPVANGRRGEIYLFRFFSQMLMFLGAQSIAITAVTVTLSFNVLKWVSMVF